MTDKEYPKILQEYNEELDELRISVEYPDGEKVLVCTKSRAEVEEENEAWEQILAEGKRYIEEHKYGEMKPRKGEPVVVEIPFDAAWVNEVDKDND